MMQLKNIMSIYNDSRIHKKMIHERCKSFERFNTWERKISEKPGPATCLAILSELYDMMPDQAKQKPVNVEGIIKMRESLACLA